MPESKLNFNLDKDQIFAFLRRNLHVIFAVALFVWCWTLVYAVALYQPKYTADSTVLIKDSAITNTYVVSDQNYGGAIQTTSSNAANPVLNTMGLLKSGMIADELYAFLQEKYPDELKKRNITTLRQWEAFYGDGQAFVKAKNQPGTDLITVEFTWNNPKIASEGLKVVLKAFQDASLRVNKSEQHSRSIFLEGQIGGVEARLEEVRRKKSAFKSANETVSIDREGGDLAGTRMDLENRLKGIQTALRGKDAELAKYQAMLGMTPEKAFTASALGQNGTLTKLQDQRYTLSQTYAQLRTNLTERNPKVQEVKAQLDQVDASIQEEMNRTMGRSFQDDGVLAIADATRGMMVNQMMTAQAESIRMRAEVTSLQNHLAGINQQIRSFPKMEEQLANITQEERILSNALDTLRSKVLEAQMKEAQTLSNVFIVDKPRQPTGAKFPTATHILILGLGMGVLAGVATAFAKDKLFAGNGFSIPWQPGPGNNRQAVPAPVQAAVPVAEPPRKRELPELETIRGTARQAASSVKGYATPPATAPERKPQLAPTAPTRFQPLSVSEDFLQGIRKQQQTRTRQTRPDTPKPNLAVLAQAAERMQAVAPQANATPYSTGTTRERNQRVDELMRRYNDQYTDRQRRPYPSASSSKQLLADLLGLR
jgi:uncharacterized protein involved in exopolysaccharide biosynthesis